jgi:hypothetical protein
MQHGRLVSGRGAASSPYGLSRGLAPCGRGPAAFHAAALMPFKGRAAAISLATRCTVLVPTPSALATVAYAVEFPLANEDRQAP